MTDLNLVSNPDVIRYRHCCAELRSECVKQVQLYLLSCLVLFDQWGVGL
jgi:hypothetical protein